MRVLAGSLGAGTKVKAAQGKTPGLSKVAKLNAVNRLFFPIVKDEKGNRDIRIAMIAGRRLSYEKLGKTFVALTDFDMDDSGKVIDKSGLAPYQRISRALHDAEFIKKKKDKERDAAEYAESVGKPIDTIALSESIRQLKVQYYGDDQAEPKVYPSVGQLISGVVLLAATEAVCVPCTGENESPDWKQASLASITISTKKSTALTSILGKSKCNIPGRDAYLETSYNFLGKDAKTASMNAVIDEVTAETSIEKQAPESWAANVDGMIKNLPKDAEMIAVRNSTMSSGTTPKEAIELIKKYLSKQQTLLLHLDYESDDLKAAAKDMIDSGIVDEAPRIKERLLEIVDNATAERDARERNDEDIVSNEIPDAVKVQTLQELTETVDDIDALAGDSLEEF